MPNRLFEMIMTSTSDLTASGVVLRLALVATSMFATIHLISLWGTRYGDNNTSAKSFFLSLVLHGCFGLGWATVAESYPRRSVGEVTETVNTPITFIDSDDVAPRQGTNPLPIFNAGPANSESIMSRDPRGLSRIDREAAMTEVESPQVGKGPESVVAPDLPAFPTQREEQAPGLEQPASMASTPSVAAASSDSTVVGPVVEARPETNTATTARTNVNRPPTANEAIPRNEFKRGAASRMNSFIEEGISMTLPSDIEVDALPKPQGLPANDSIRRPSSPNPNELIDSVAGSGADGNSKTDSPSGGQRKQRISRSGNRPGEGSDDFPSRPAIASNSMTTGRPVDDRIVGNRSLPDSSEESPAPLLATGKMSAMTRAPARAPETYQARTSGQRMASVLKHGGSEESEKAVENSLKWMASVQESNGRWSSSRHGGGVAKRDPQADVDRLDGGKFADSGVTGLVLLSFLGAGYTHEKGPYTAEVRNGINWIISQQQANGYLGGNATKYDQNYCHAIATFALAEAYAMQKDASEFPELRHAVERGVKMISALQNDDGGWRYGRGEKKSDMSMFGWQLMALKSAVNGGISVPEKTRRGMVRFLETQALGEYGGLAGYRTDDKPTPAMTAEALFCRQMFSVRTNDGASQEAVGYLKKHLPRITEYDEYYWYYGTLAMHHIENDAWLEWNAALRDMLVSMQRQEGMLAGSWDPRGKWAGIGGRLYSTALSTLCLEVYYRYTTIAKPESAQ